MVARDMEPTSPPTKPPSSRLHYMDAMRSILMLMGVFFHASVIYADPVKWPWIVKHGESSFLFTAYCTATGTFRMPTFFMISGYFALLTLDRHGTGRFLYIRLRRLAIPLIATAVLLNTAEAWITYFMTTGATGGFIDYLVGKRHVADGGWVGHLWFLNHLVVYFGLIALISLAVPGAGVPWVRRHVSRLPGVGAMLANGRYLLFLPLATVAVTATYIIPGVKTPLLGFLSPFWLLWFVPFFLFGMWMRDDPRLLQDFTVPRAWYFGVLVAAIVARNLLPAPKEAASLGLQVASVYAQALSTWIACALCFALFKRLFDRPSPVFGYLSEASYTIYLFHHIGAVLAGFLLLDLALSPYLEYGIIVITVALYALIVHHFLVLRFSLIRLLFNGKSR